MIAVIRTGGKQYAVKAGQVLKVEKINAKIGENISLNKVLMLIDSTSHTVGNPLIKGALIEAKIIDQIRDKKIIVFKKKKRKNYRLTQGHRQYLTLLHIESIIHGTKKSVAPKKDTKNKKDKIVKKLEKEEVSKDERNVIKKKIVKKATSNKEIAKKPATKKAAKKKTTKAKK